MIAVDTNVIAAYCGVNEKKEIARKVWEKDPEWHAPLLWISEFRNALVLFQRRGFIRSDLFADVLSESHELVSNGRTHNVGDKRVLDLTSRSGCTAYDCEFVAVAEALGVKLVTWDKELLKRFPERTISPEEFVKTR